MSTQAVLLLLATAVAIVDGQNWVQLPGSAKQISAKGSNLWALTRYDQPIRWDGQKWLFYNGRATYVAATDGASGDVAILIGYGSLSGNRYWFNPLTKMVYGAYAQYAFTMSHLLQYVVIVALDGTVQTCSYDGTSWGSWITIDNSGVNKQAGVGVDRVIWKVDQNGNVYRYTGSGTTWEQQQTDAAMGFVKYIDVQNATRVVATDTNNNAWLWNGSAWSQLSGHQCAQATIGDKSVFCIDPSEAIWRLDV